MGKYRLISLHFINDHQSRNLLSENLEKSLNYNVTGQKATNKAGFASMLLNEHRGYSPKIKKIEIFTEAFLIKIIELNSKPFQYRVVRIKGIFGEIFESNPKLCCVLCLVSNDCTFFYKIISIFNNICFDGSKNQTFPFSSYVLFFILCCSMLSFERIEIIKGYTFSDNLAKLLNTGQE